MPRENILLKVLSPLIVEFIGTFFISWTVAISVNCDIMMAAMAIGAVITAYAVLRNLDIIKIILIYVKDTLLGK